MLSRTKGRQRFVVYIGGLFMNFMYEMDMYLNNIHFEILNLYVVIIFRKTCTHGFEKKKNRSK